MLTLRVLKVVALMFLHSDKGVSNIGDQDIYKKGQEKDIIAYVILVYI